MIKILFLTFLLMFSHVSVSAGITNLKLSTAQIFDVQWNITNGRLNASGFNHIFASINYATQTTSAARWTAAQTQDAGANGRYIGFFNSTTHPGTYGMAVFNSDGTRYKTINNTGTFRALADGAIFYNGNGMWGTLITTGQGYSNGQSGSWAVTQNNPTNAQLQAYTPPSSTPLAAGQTAQSSSPPPPPPPPPPPTPVYGPSGITQQQQIRRTANLLQNPNGHNVAIEITGDDNVVSIQQVGGAGHYINVDLSGNVNNVNVLQTTTDLTTRHYMEANVSGNNNSLLLQQRQTPKTQFVDVNGNFNSVTTDQRGTGNHHLDLKVTGNNHTTGVVQDGSGSHRATVDLNGNQPWNFTLNQSGSTGKTYTLPHTMSDGSGVNGTCNAVGGCNLIVNQQ